MTLRRTPFHALASAMGAQMGPVGGGFLNVHSYGDVAAEPGGNVTHLIGAQDMVFSGAVGEVHPHHVGTGADDPLEDAVAIGRRTECGYNLCTSWHERLQCEVDMT